MSKFQEKTNGESVPNEAIMDNSRCSQCSDDVHHAWAHVKSSCIEQNEATSPPEDQQGEASSDHSVKFCV